MAEPEGSGAPTHRLQESVISRLQSVERAAEKMIVDGHVEVDGAVTSWYSGRPQVAVVIDGARVVARRLAGGAALNKPRGMHSTMSDSRGPPRASATIPTEGRGAEAFMSDA